MGFFNLRQDEDRIVAKILANPAYKKHISGFLVAAFFVSAGSYYLLSSQAATKHSSDAATIAYVFV